MIKNEAITEFPGNTESVPANWSEAFSILELFNNIGNERRTILQFDQTDLTVQFAILVTKSKFKITER